MSANGVLGNPTGAIGAHGWQLLAEMTAGCCPPCSPRPERRSDERGPMSADPRGPDQMRSDQAKVALVTGAAWGIGASPVHLLAGQRWSVVAVDAHAGPHPRPDRSELAALTAGGEVPDVVAHVRDLGAAEATD